MALPTPGMTVDNLSLGELEYKISYIVLITSLLYVMHTAI